MLCPSLFVSVINFVAFFVLVGPYEELIASDGIVEEYFAFDATSVTTIIP